MPSQFGEIEKVPTARQRSKDMNVKNKKSLKIFMMNLSYNILRWESNVSDPSPSSTILYGFGV